MEWEGRRELRPTLELEGRRGHGPLLEREERYLMKLKCRCELGPILNRRRGLSSLLKLEGAERLSHAWSGTGGMRLALLELEERRGRRPLVERKGRRGLDPLLELA